MFAGIGGFHLYAQCVFTLWEIQGSGHPTWNNFEYLETDMFTLPHTLCADLFLLNLPAPSFPPHSFFLTLWYSCSLYLWGGFVLTEAVCAPAPALLFKREAPRCWDWQRKSGEKKKTEGAAGKATWEGWSWTENRKCTICPLIHCPVKIRNGVRRMTTDAKRRMLQYSGMDVEAVGKVKRLLWILCQLRRL